MIVQGKKMRNSLSHLMDSYPLLLAGCSLTLLRGSGKKSSSVGLQPCCAGVDACCV